VRPLFFMLSFVHWAEMPAILTRENK